MPRSKKPNPKAEGGAYINEGTYGCVFSPPIECMDTTPVSMKKSKLNKSKKVVGKLFVDSKSFHSEVEQATNIQKLDPEYKFTVPYLGTCKTKRSLFKQSDQGFLCQKPLNDAHTYNQMLYSNGGVELRDYFKKPAKYTHDIAIDDIILASIPLFEGILEMQKKDYVHLDIKPSNILMDTTKKPHGLRLSLIDFGLMTKRLNLKYQFNLHKHKYPYYPPEFQAYFATVIEHNYDVNNVIYRCLQNFSLFHILSFEQWLNQRWPYGKYREDIISAVNLLISKSLYSFVKDFDRILSYKVDSYSLAMSLIEVIYWSEVNKNHKINVRSQEFLNKTLSNVLFPMIHPNPYIRMGLEEGLKRLKDLVSPPSKPADAAVVSIIPSIPAKSARGPNVQPVSEKQKAIIKAAIAADEKIAKAEAKAIQEVKAQSTVINGKKLSDVYRKPLHLCNNSEANGGYSVVELRAIARELGLQNKMKRKDICDELKRIAQARPRT